MKNKSSARALIRQMAQDAKTRMLNKEYGTRQENQLLKRNIKNGNNLKLYLYNKKEDITIKVIEDDSEEFKNKVYELLEKDRDVVNPLKQLINQDEFDKLSEKNKEKMILNISEQYTQIRNQYYNTYC